MTISTIEKEFDKKYFGNGKFPKRISDPILCDDIKAFYREQIGELIDEERSRIYDYLIKGISNIVFDIEFDPKTKK